MDRAERRRRTRLVVKRRRWYIDGFFGHVIHPAEFHFDGTEEDYHKELREYHIDLKRRLGRAKWRHPWDCGKTRCGVCHRHKHPRELTSQEAKSRKDFQEQLKDFWSEDEYFI